MVAKNGFTLLVMHSVKLMHQTRATAFNSALERRRSWELCEGIWQLGHFGKLIFRIIRCLRVSTGSYHYYVEPRNCFCYIVFH